MSTWTTYARKPEKAIPEPESLELQPGGPAVAKPAWFRPTSQKSRDMQKIHDFLQGNLRSTYKLSDISTLTGVSEIRTKAACKTLCGMGLAFRTDESQKQGKKFVKVIYVQGRNLHAKIRKGSWV